MILASHCSSYLPITLPELNSQLNKTSVLFKQPPMYVLYVCLTFLWVDLFLCLSLCVCVPAGEQIVPALLSESWP